MLTSRIKQVNLDCISFSKLISDLTKKPDSKGNYPKLFKYWNIWDNQIDEMISGKNYSFNTPSFFVEIDLGDGKNWNVNYTTYPEAIIRFHIVNMILDGGNDTMEQNLQIFDIRDMVVTAFKNAQISWCSDGILVEDRMDYKHGNTYKYVLGFKTNFIDSKGSIYDVDSGSTTGTGVNLEVSPDNNNVPVLVNGNQ